MTHREVTELVAGRISAQRRDPIHHRSPHQQQAWVAREHLLDELAHDFVAALSLYGPEASRFLVLCRVRSEVPNPEGGMQ